jgi:hypothetical protein
MTAASSERRIELLAASAGVSADEMRERIRALVDAAPPLTPAQRARLAAIFAAARRPGPRPTIRTPPAR